MSRWEVLVGDCRDVMSLTMDDNSVDAIVTDPPYELGFMGKTWDASGIAYDQGVWREALRVLKPGGHMLAFSGSRTYHRMVVAIEDAGFEIRDQLMWLYGSGFPKSLDVSKAIDKAAGAEREVVGSRTKNTALGGNDIMRENGRKTGAANYSVASGDGRIKYANVEIPVTAPATPEAERWSGWGTALKPAHEPIVLARKPLIGTVAANVLAHGTGALNIDGCRVEGVAGRPAPPNSGYDGRMYGAGLGEHREVSPPHSAGRWPANVMHDGSDEVLAGFPDAKGATSNGRKGVAGVFENGLGPADQVPGYGDSGSAARFFYCPKASRKDRNDGGDNAHPTVKPTELMRYLCRLITPPGGLVFDPFTGSGSTGRGAVLEGFDFLGAELSDEYAAIARARIAKAAS